MLGVGPVDDDYFLVPAESTRSHDFDRLPRDDKIPAVGARAVGDMDDRVDPILVLVDRQGAQFLVDMIGLDRGARERLAVLYLAQRLMRLGHIAGHHHQLRAIERDYPLMHHLLAVTLFLNASRRCHHREHRHRERRQRPPRV